MQKAMDAIKKVSSARGLKELSCAIVKNSYALLGGQNMFLLYKMGNRLYYTDLLCSQVSPLFSDSESLYPLFEYTGLITEQAIKLNVNFLGDKGAIAEYTSIRLCAHQEVVGVLLSEGAVSPIPSEYSLFIEYTSHLLYNIIRNFPAIQILENGDSSYRAEQAAATELEIGAKGDVIYGEQDSLRIKRYIAAYEQSPMAIAIYRQEDKQIVDINKAFEKLLGYNYSEIVGVPTNDLELYYDIADVENITMILQRNESLYNYEMEMRRKDGETITILNSANKILLDGKVHFLSTLIDITERKKSEQLVERINRKLKVIRAVIQIASNIQQEKILMEETCKLLCHEAGYKFAWIGLVNSTEEQCLYPLAWAESVTHILEMSDMCKIFAKGEHDPALIAIKEGSMTFVHDLLAANTPYEWRDMALLAGCRSVVSLPLRDSSLHVFAVITIFSDQPNMFDAEEIKLLNKITFNIANAIIILRNKDERRRAELALRQSEARYYSLFNLMEEGVAINEVITNEQGDIVDYIIIDVNQGFYKHTPYKDTQVIGRTATELYSMSSSMIRQWWKEHAAIKTPVKTEYYHAPENRWFLITTTPPEENRFATIFTEITERKRIEAERNANLVFFQNMNEINTAIHSSKDFDTMIQETLKVVVRLFNCDRAWVIYPCDPEAEYWELVKVYTKPEFAESDQQYFKKIPMDDEVRRVNLLARTYDYPVTFGRGSQYTLSEKFCQDYNFRALICTALYPKIDKPWGFGLHQCLYDRIWTPEELNLLQEIGRRLADGLTGMLILRNLQESENKFSKAFKHSPTALSISSFETGIYLDVNENLLQALGYERSELIGANAIDLQIWDDINKRNEFLKMLVKDGQVKEYEFKFRCKNGDIRLGQTSGTLITINQEKCILLQANDITDKKNSERELENYRLHLEELVRVRTKEYSELNEKLHEQLEQKRQIEYLLNKSLEKEKELSEMKSRFISTTSHEFRTPLTSVLSSIQMIRRYKDRWNDELFEEHFERINRSIGNLTRLLDDILTINKVESGKTSFNPQYENLHGLCLDIIEEIGQYITPSHSFDFIYTPSEQFYYFDIKLLKRILQNLLSNAFRYSPEGGKVKLKIDFIAREKLLRITITDEGIGIPQKERSHLFEPFFRARNTGDIVGTGFGLSIVKHSVDLHRGGISFQSREGSGTKFIITIPTEIHETENTDH
ncbi:MAG: PAS domain S-box protein [Ignavibacteria bacterium]|nr:PAS domain S-box protein [Ignavibacteria bacterium]